jgi:hypothetical protein
MLTSGLKANGFGMVMAIYGEMVIGRFQHEVTDGSRVAGHREDMDIIGRPVVGVDAFIHSTTSVSTNCDDGQSSIK